MGAAHRYSHEVIDVMVAQASDLHAVLARGHQEGVFACLDGSLIRTDRCSARPKDDDSPAHTGTTAVTSRSCADRTATPNRSAGPSQTPPTTSLPPATPPQRGVEER